MIKWWLLPVEDVSRHLLYCGTGLGCPLFHGLLYLSTLAESNAATSQRAVLLGTDSHHSHCDCFQPFMESHAEYIFTNSTTILSQFHIKEAHTWQHCCLHGENVVSIFCRNMWGSAVHLCCQMKHKHKQLVRGFLRTLRTLYVRWERWFHSKTARGRNNGWEGEVTSHGIWK